MPDELTINGVLYVRAGAQPSEMLTAAQVAQMAHKDVHSVYAAMNAGLLPYSVPNGCKRPRMVRRADAMAWIGGNGDAGEG